MLIEDWRPQLYCKGLEVDNISPNGKVFFKEKGHKYYHEDDIVDGVLVPFEETKYQFRSPTGLLADFKEKFNANKIAKAYVIKHGLDISWQELVHQWDDNALKASTAGTELHAYGESLWNGWPMPRPEKDKSRFVEETHRELSSRYALAKTELLVFNTTLRIAGQVDLLLRNKDKTEYYLEDYKFLSRPIEKKSYFNPKTRKYKMMKGPFRRLMDGALSHYSIQMELYRMLMGEFGKKVKSKVLIVVSPEGVEYVDGLPMTIWVDHKGYLQAKYYLWDKSLYNSSRDKVYMRKPYKIY
jgi:hypothetical protein